MQQSVNSPRAGWLQLPLTRYIVLNRALLVLGALLLLAVVSRFWDLGSRALHHDESLHAVYSYYLYDRGEYKHDPLMHGPVLFHLTALGYWLFGVSDATSRLVPAILGVILVWLPWKFRGWLGVKGALAASTLVLISPTILYYSRFIREDVFAITWTVMIVYAMMKYLEGGEDFHLYLTAAGWALLFSQKEISFLLAFVFWTFLAGVVALRWLGRLGPKVDWREMREWHLLVMIGGLLLPHASALLLHLIGMDPAGGYTATAYRDMSFLARAATMVVVLGAISTVAAATLWNLRKFLIAAGIFYAIFFLLHTTFLTWPWGIGSGLVGALGYWIDQHAVERGGQPWYYYLMLTPLYEYLPLLLGLGGGGYLLARRRGRDIAPVTKENHHLNARALWPWFNLWWFAASFFIFSYAGEKMPWLLVHLAYPLIMLAGWALDRLTSGVAWRRAWEQGAFLFGILVGLAFLAGVSLFGLAFTAQWPGMETDVSALQSAARWLGSLALLIGAGWAAARYSDRLGRPEARAVALLAVCLVMALASVRFAMIASFRNADVPHEPLIYTQTSPNVPMVMRELEMISEQIAGGKNLQVAYDNSTLWPFEWYLRDYPNKFYFADNPSAYADSVRAASVVLVGLDNEQLVKPLVNGYIRHHYSMRPNFPEDYKDLTNATIVVPDPAEAGATITQTESQPNNPFVILNNLWKAAQSTEARRDFAHFLWHREVDTLGTYDFVVYVKPEVAAQVWQYGLTVATMDPALTRDPYADVTVELPAAILLDRPGDFLNPRNVVVLPEGQLAVADSGNHRIRIFEQNGTPVTEFGMMGAAPGQFNEPWGLAAAPDGTLYVADTWNHRVQHVTVEGDVLGSWGEFADTGGEAIAPGSFWGPRAIAVDADGNVYVTDTGNKRVQKFDGEGTFLGQFGTPGAEPGQFAEPVGIAVSPDGTIWVADTWNRRVQGFNPDFTPLVQFPVRAWSGESVANKPYIAASDDRVWITDPEGYRIIEFDHAGEVQRVWGQFGSDTLGLNLPVGLSFDPERQILWVADSENQRVLGYEME